MEIAVGIPTSMLFQVYTTEYLILTELFVLCVRNYIFDKLYSAGADPGICLAGRKLQT